MADGQDIEIGNLVLTPDTVEGTRAELGSTTSYYARGFFVRYKNLATMPDTPYVIGDIYRSIRASGAVWGAQSLPFRNLGLSKIPIVPLGAGQFRVQLIYENVNPGGFSFQSAYIREDDTVVQSYATNFVPGTREPITCDYISGYAQAAGADGDQVKAFDAKVPEDYVLMNLLRPVRTLRVTQVRFGAPRDNNADFVGAVNGDKFLKKPPGYWMLMGYKTIASKYEGYYTSIITAYTKNSESWREFGALRHRQTGRYCPIPRKQIQLLTSLPYSKSPGVVKKGFTHVGVTAVDPYPTVSFQSIFGFST